MKYHRTAFVCSICKTEIGGEYDNNPWPYPGKSCCDRCNNEKVIPARMEAIAAKSGLPEYLQIRVIDAIVARCAEAMADERVATPAEESK
jgi:hypothetical protein